MRPHNLGLEDRDPTAFPFTGCESLAVAAGDGGVCPILHSTVSTQQLARLLRVARDFGAKLPS